ncbi:uncharacterized protein [Amphiura filiformis]|uniref:uncharacterized protein n=1 Tax=Amphiura filiformis TaxID=82378 RepID=UPI003B218499
MPSNIEIKARLTDPEFVKRTSLELSESKTADILEQEDTFFNCQQGRLKLRVFKNQSDRVAKLISYERPDTTGPKHSLFSITPIHEPEALKVTLTQALGVIGVVKKTRTLVHVGQTRVHIDDVYGLGQFMELEVMMRPGQNHEEGAKIAKDLKKKLGIKETDLIDCAYMDLILEQTQNGGTS